MAMSCAHRCTHYDYEVWTNGSLCGFELLRDCSFALLHCHSALFKMACDASMRMGFISLWLTTFLTGIIKEMSRYGLFLMVLSNLPFEAHLALLTNLVNSIYPSLISIYLMCFDYTSQWDRKCYQSHVFWAKNIKKIIIVLYKNLILFQVL